MEEFLFECIGIFASMPTNDPMLVRNLMASVIEEHIVILNAICSNNVRIRIKTHQKLTKTSTLLDRKLLYLKIIRLLLLGQSLQNQKDRRNSETKTKTSQTTIPQYQTLTKILI